MSDEFSGGELIIERLRPEHSTLLAQFSSISQDENEFLMKDAVAHQRMKVNETYLLFREKERNKILSYITLAIGSIQLPYDKEFYGVKIREKPVNLPNRLPCMLIGRMATDKTERNRGYATYLIKYAMKIASERSAITPFPLLALHAYPSMIHFYERFGFLPTRKPRKNSETVPMYLPLFKE